MKFFLTVSALLAVACGRPEPPSSFSSYAAPPPNQGGGNYAGRQPVYGAPPQAPVVHKHVYVHVPPPEPEVPVIRKPITVQPPQKHYKIVFIKAPTAPTPTVPVIPVQPQDSEKTLIYVLVKKPEEQPEIEIPTVAPTQPTKPEVYFIRYKTQKQEQPGGYPDRVPAAQPPSQYGAPSGPAPSGQYGAPQTPSDSYGGPSAGASF